MTDPYLLRPARPAEAELIPALETEAAGIFAAFGLSDLADLPSHDTDFYRRCAEAGTLWLAVAQAASAGGAAIGFCAAAERDGAAWLVELNVLPAHGRRGLGRRLAERAIDWAEGCDLPEIVLTTFRDIPFNAPFYRRLGFREIEPGFERPHLAAVRARERANGLDAMHPRIAMALPLPRRPEGERHHRWPGAPR